MVKNYKCFKIRNKTNMPSLVTIMQHSFGSPTYGNKRRKKIKGIQIRKKVKLSFFADGMLLYIENTKDATR